MPIDRILPTATIRLDAGTTLLAKRSAPLLLLTCACNAEMAQRPALHGGVAAPVLSAVGHQIADEIFRSMATQQGAWHLPDLSDRWLLALGMASQTISDGDGHALRNSNLTTDEYPLIAEFRRILRAHDATGQPLLDTARDPAAPVGGAYGMPDRLWVTSGPRLPMLEYASGMP